MRAPHNIFGIAGAPLVIALARVTRPSGLRSQLRGCRSREQRRTRREERPIKKITAGNLLAHSKQLVQMRAPVRHCSS